MEDRKPVPFRAVGTSTVVHTELGVPISFDPQSATFKATVGEDRNSADLESASFDAVIERIRQRTLVEPVDAYTIHVRQGYGPGEGAIGSVRVEPVEIIEYHRGRQEPFVARLKDGGQTRGRLAYRYAEDALFLPSEADIARLRALGQELGEEYTRHREKTVEISDAIRSAMGALRHPTTADIRHVQKTGQQVAQPNLGTE